MTSVLYLLRSPSHIVLPALYQESGTALVVSMEDQSLVPKPATIVAAPSECVWKAGQSLSYRELMSLVVESEKVVTL